MTVKVCDSLSCGGHTWTYYLRNAPKRTESVVISAFEIWVVLYDSTKCQNQTVFLRCVSYVGLTIDEILLTHIVREVRRNVPHCCNAMLLIELGLTSLFSTVRWENEHPIRTLLQPSKPALMSLLKPTTHSNVYFPTVQYMQYRSDRSVKTGHGSKKHFYICHLKNHVGNRAYLNYWLSFSGYCFKIKLLDVIVDL